jgi:hypothetical protein
VVGRIEQRAQPVARGQSAHDELREAVDSHALAYGYLTVRAFQKPPLVATALGDSAVRRMIDGCRLEAIPAGSPAVDGCIVRDDRRGFWVRRVRPDHAWFWQLIEVPTAFDILRAGDARNAMSADSELEEALIIWGIVRPPQSAA